MTDAMGTESEELRLSVEARLTRIEERVGQLLLDRTQLYNAIANLRRTVQSLETYKTRMQVRDEQEKEQDEKEDKRSQRKLALIALLFAVVQGLIQLAFHYWR